MRVTIVAPYYILYVAKKHYIPSQLRHMKTLYYPYIDFATFFFFKNVWISVCAWDRRLIFIIIFDLFFKNLHRIFSREFQGDIARKVQYGNLTYSHDDENPMQRKGCLQKVIIEMQHEAVKKTGIILCNGASNQESKRD